MDGEVRLNFNVHGSLYTDATSTDLDVKWRFMSGMMTMKAQAGTNAAKIRATPLRYEYEEGRGDGGEESECRVSRTECETGAYG